MSDAGSLVTGLAESINQYIGAQTKASIDQQTETAKQNSELARQKDLLKYQHDMAGDEPQEPTVSPDMAEKAMPGMGGTLVSSFQKQNGRLPTLKEAHQYLQDAQSALPDPTKTDNHQDQLEKQATDRLTQIRGDAAINRTELQRDASGQAYDTITKAESEGRPLTELEQGDVIRQLIQARTGKTPSDQDVKDLNEKTGKRGFNHLITYLTGSPSIVGASTDATLANLKQFVVSTGLKADQQHEAYMAPRLIKPTGLESERWDHIVNTQRGLPFQHQMEVSDKTYKAAKAGNGSLADKKAALRAKLGL